MGLRARAADGGIRRCDLNPLGMLDCLRAITVDSGRLRSMH